MDDRLLPKIRLNDAYTDGMESPFTATDVGRSTKPRSTTSSDGECFVFNMECDVDFRFLRLQRFGSE